MRTSLKNTDAGGERDRFLSDSQLLAIIERNESTLLAEWLHLARESNRSSNIADQQVFEENSQTFIGLLRRALVDGSPNNLSTQPWTRMRDFLITLSRQRAEAGATPSETANF